jgi:glycerophosphoryl diester phosphodiesterase
VDSTRLIDIEEGPERRAADLAAAGVDAINLPEPDWTGGLTTLFHRFGIRCLGWNAQHPRQLDRLLALGIDGVFSDHVDRMVDALGRR